MRALESSRWRLMTDIPLSRSAVKTAEMFSSNIKYSFADDLENLSRLRSCNFFGRREIFIFVEDYGHGRTSYHVMNRILTNFSIVLYFFQRFEARTSGAAKGHSRDAGQRKARKSRRRRERKVGPHQIAAGLSFQQ